MNIIKKNINNILKELKSLDINKKRNKIAYCSNEAESLGADFFGDILQNEEDPICKWYAIRAIGELKSWKYKDLLINLLCEKDVKVGDSSLHLITARSTGMLGKRITPLIIEMIKNGNCNLIPLIDCLGEIGDPISIPYLYDYLIKGDKNSQLWSSLSLSKIGIKSIPILNQAIEICQSNDLAFIILDTLVMIRSPLVLKGIILIIKRFHETAVSYIKESTSEKVELFKYNLKKWSEPQKKYKKSAIYILNFLNNI